jgi:autotransporter-associated beta strand protein
MTLGADSTIDVDGTQLTISTAIGDGGNGYAITKDGNGTLVLSATSTYTGDTTISAGTMKLTGNLNSATDLVIASGATLDLQAALTAATLDLDGTISNTAGTSSLVISGASSLGGSVTTTSTQTYTGAATLTGNSTLTTSSAQVTFSNTINSEGSETNNLTVTASELQLDGIVGGTRTLGVMDINGTLDLNAAITNATSIDVSSTSNLGANVTTTGTQTYTGATTLSGGDRTLTGSAVNFGNTVTGTASHDLTITGNLDLDGALTSVVDFSVSGTSNLGANVTTSGTQTYTGAVTLSAATITLTTTDSDVTFGSTIDSDSGQTRNLTIDTNGTTAMIQFVGAVGDTVPLDVITITGNLDLNAGIANAAGITVQSDMTVNEDITTTGAQTYNGDVIVAGDAILTTTNSKITFNGTVNSESLEANDLGFVVGTSEVEFNDIVGGVANGGLGAIAITGALNLDAAISSAASLSVSTTSDLGANVTTSGTQTYTGNVTISADVSITTSGGNVSFDGNLNTNFSASSSNSTLTYGYSGDSGKTSASSYSISLSADQTITRIVMYGGSGGNGGCDGQCGSDTGRPGYLDATVNISDSTINIAPGGGGGTGASNVNWNTAGGTAGANTLNSSFNGGTGGRAGSNGSSGAGGGGGAASLVEVGSGSGIYLVAGGAGGGGAGRFQNGTPGENTYTANGTSYTGANGQDVGGSRDGGGAGGGGGGYYGGQQNGLYVVSGEYEGYGGHRGANGIVDSEGNFAAASTINSNTYYGSSTSNGQIGQVVLTLSTTSYSYAEHNLTISTGAGTVDMNGDVANIGTLSVTTTSSDSDISGVISTDTILTKAGAGTLTLSGTNTYTGQTNVNAGTLAVTVNDALGTNAAGTVIASGATLDLRM